MGTRECNKVLIVHSRLANQDGEELIAGLPLIGPVQDKEHITIPGIGWVYVRVISGGPVKAEIRDFSEVHQHFLPDYAK